MNFICAELFHLCLSLPTANKRKQTNRSTDISEENSLIVIPDHTVFTVFTVVRRTVFAVLGTLIIPLVK